MNTLSPQRSDASAVGVDPAAAPLYHEGDENGLGILLLHGLTATPTEMRPLFDFLREHRPEHSLTCPLLPGHGTSPADLKATDPQAWTIAVDHELDSLAGRHNRLCIAGVSMGGLLAVQAAVRDSRVRAVMLLAPMLGLKPIASVSLSILCRLRSYKRKSRRSRANHRKHGLHTYDCYPLRSLVHLRAMASDTQLLLPELHVPTLIATGRRDPYLSQSFVERMSRAIGTDQLEWIECPQSAHILPHEPDAPMLFKKLDDFLARALPREPVD